MPRFLLVLLIGLALVAPFTSAAPSRFTFDGRTGTSLVLAQDETYFELTLHEGDVLDSALSWPSPASQLSLSIERPCTAPDSFCAASAALTTTRCEGSGSGAALGSARSLHFVAPGEGDYVLVVAGVVNAVGTPFHLTLDGDAGNLGSLRGPFGDSGVHGSRPLCAV